MLAGVAERVDIDLCVDVVQRGGDAGGVLRPENPGFREHHQMRAVDRAHMGRIMLFHPFEERCQHGVAVGRVGECGLVRHPLSPAMTTPRMMKRWKIRNTTRVGIVEMAAPVMMSSQATSASSTEGAETDRERVHFVPSW